jgi:hypothetical protein
MENNDLRYKKPEVCRLTFQLTFATDVVAESAVLTSMTDINRRMIAATTSVCALHIPEVTGSNPVPPMRKPSNYGLFPHPLLTRPVLQTDIILTFQSSGCVNAEKIKLILESTKAWMSLRVSGSIPGDS